MTKYFLNSFGTYFYGNKGPVQKRGLKYVYINVFWVVMEIFALLIKKSCLDGQCRQLFRLQIDFKISTNSLFSGSLNYVLLQISR